MRTRRRRRQSGWFCGFTQTGKKSVVEYKYETGQRVRLNDGRTGEISCRVPGNGRGTGFYYIQIDPYWNDGEIGPLSDDEFESE